MNNLTPEEIAEYKALQSRSPRGNEAVATFREHPVGQVIGGLVDPAINTAYGASVGIDRQMAKLMGNDPLLQPKKIQTSEGPYYEAAKLPGEIAQWLGTKTPMGAMVRGMSIGAANNPVDPERGAILGIAEGALGEGIGKAIGGGLQAAGKGYQKFIDKISLDPATKKYVDMISESYNVSKEKAWEMMSSLVGKTEEGGLAGQALIKEIPAPTIQLEEAADKYRKSKEFKTEFGSDGADQFDLMISEAIENGVGNAGKMTEKEFNKYLNSKAFKSAHGKEASAIKDEYKDMYQSMFEYLGERAPGPTTQMAPGIDKFISLTESNKSFIPPDAKPWISKFKQEPTIGNAYEIVKELKSAARSLGPSDVSLKNTYLEMADSLENAFTKEGERLAPGTAEKYAQGKQKYASEVAPYFTNPEGSGGIIERAAGGNALPTVELRPLIQAIEKGMEKPARGKYPDISPEHNLANVARRANEDIGIADTMLSENISKAILALTGGLGTYKGRENKKQIAQKVYALGMLGEPSLNYLTKGISSYYNEEPK